MSSTIEEAGEQEASELNTDFRMVTFTLGGRDYGIDIMKVKEIAQSSQFTYVPNTAPHVRGVHNLRGEIISVIDLRRMFQLGIDSKSSVRGLENILILRLEEVAVGVVVDTIDHVVGVDSRSIQAPHPLFADIKVNYMRGVVEARGRTYVILDVERIFGRHETSTGPEPAVPRPAAKVVGSQDMELDFIIQALATLRGFHVTDVNREWVEKRFREWKSQRGESASDLQLTSEGEVEAFLDPFWSIDAGRLFDEKTMGDLQLLMLDPVGGRIVKIWDVGCARGHEAYSLAVAARLRYPDAQIKVWAIDKDLLSVSVAPNLVVPKDEVPSLYVKQSLVSESPSGYTFVPKIRDAVVFEYHDILHGNEYPTLDVIVARDVLSLLTLEEQRRILGEMEGLLRDGGLLIVGSNEAIPGAAWTRVEQGSIVGYRKVGG